MPNELLRLFGRPRAAELDPTRLPGFAQEYLRLVSANTDARPGLLLTAWLPFCAVNLGNRAYMLNNSLRVYPNIWSCVIGPSSVSRKTTALRYAGYTLAPWEEALNDAPLSEYEAQTLVLNGVTLAKLLSYLALNPARLFVHNELAAWLHEMNKSFNAGYKQVITELYDGVDRTVANRERTERIVRPALSIAAASTEGWLYKNMLEGADQLGGFLQRMLFYVVRQIDVAELDLKIRADSGLGARLAEFDARYFQPWRSLPGSWRLELSEPARQLRDAAYEERYKRCFALGNDNLMSYFTRIYDGYWFKFCTLFTLAEFAAELHSSLKAHCLESFFAHNPVDTVTAEQAFYLCDFYLDNTLPLLELMEEQDKLAAEHRIVDALRARFAGRAKHSELMNACHMRKNEFRAAIESLIEREALSVETYGSGSHVGKRYVLNTLIVEDWKK